MKRACAFVVFFVLPFGLSGSAQWLSHPTSGIPRTPDGKPDLSGLWLPDPGPAGRRGIGETIRSPYVEDITSGTKPEDVPFKPWAEAEYNRRRSRNSIDDPPRKWADVPSTLHRRA